MLKKTVVYEDPFNPGVEITEDLYFNLTKAEIVEMEMGVEGGLKEHLEGIARAQNGQQIMDEMKGIILKAYGKRTQNGKFIKNPQLREEFESSEAYSTMFMEMVTKADAAVEFVNGIMPKGLAEDVNQMTIDQADPERPNLTSIPGTGTTSTRILSRTEAIEMDSEELKAGLAEGRYSLQ